jgi:hypothetical protein
MRWLPPLLLLAARLRAQEVEPLNPKGGPALRPVTTVTYLEKGARYVQETYFVDAPGLRAAIKKHPGAALDALRGGLVWSGVRMTFLVDISKTKRRELVQRNLRDSWPKDAPPLAPADLKAYLDWQGRSLNQGDEVEYAFSPGVAMTIRFGKGPAKRFTTPDLARYLRIVEYSDDDETPGTMAKLEAALQALLR